MALLRKEPDQKSIHYHGSKLNNFILSYGVHYFLAVLALLAYTFIGALLFRFCEENAGAIHSRKAHREFSYQARHYRTELLRGLNRSIALSQIYDQRREQLYHLRVFEKRMNCSSEKMIKQDEDRWDMWNSLFFAGSLYTTIGYGNNKPVTFWGRLLTFPYTLLGIPLCFYVMTTLGYLFFDCVSTVWHFIWVGCRRATTSGFTRVAKKPSPIEFPPKHRGRIGERFSTIGVLIIFAIWLLLTALLYTALEPTWTYMQSVYFLYISATTIGLGDVVPSNIRVTVWSFPILFIGLSILAMFIASLQSQVETVYRRLLSIIMRTYHVGLEEDSFTSGISGNAATNDSNTTGTESIDQTVKKSLLVTSNKSRSLRRRQASAKFNTIVDKLPFFDRFIYYALLSPGRKEFLAMKYHSLRARRNCGTQTFGELARKLSWSRPVQFGQNEKFPRPVKSVNFQEKLLAPGQEEAWQRRSPSLTNADASSNVSFATAVSHFGDEITDEESSEKAPPCCFITEGTYHGK